VSRLKVRDHNKDVVIDEARFPLPFKVQHRFPTKSEDFLFYGIKTGSKQNVVQFPHVGLIGDIVDGYSPMKGYLSSPSVASVCSSKSPPFVAGSPLSLHRMKMKMKVMKSTLMCLLLIPNWNLSL
jgi:hypothetical protein